ncbi:MAG: hypothetical protein ACK4FR_02120 [Tabrizicola sp.]
MSATELALAILLLLLTPGPTNSLMLVAGAERGWSGALRLIPAELAGYFLSVLPLAMAGAALLEEIDALRSAVTLAAGTWAAVLSVFLGKGSGQPRVLFLLRRLASAWLAAISLVLIARGVGA